MSCLREVQTISKSPDILPMPSLTRLTTGGVLNPQKNTTNTSHNELLHQDPLQPPLEPRRLDDQHAAQSPCLAILVPLGMRCLINNKLHRGSGGWPHPLSAFYRPRSRSAAPVTSRCTRSVAMHPIRRDAPDQKGCNAYGSGAPPHRQQACTWFFSLARPTPESNRPRPYSALPRREHYTS